MHTDVPEFRGVNRKLHPQWLLVAMHHSGLFEDWRMPIATGVAWFHDCDGGEFAFYPDGADGPPVHHKVAYNTALARSTPTACSTASTGSPPGDAVDLPALRPGMQLAFDGDGRWVGARRRRRRRRLPLGRAALLDLVEGVLLRRRGRARRVARRTPTTCRSTRSSPRSSTTCDRGAASPATRRRRASSR